VTIQGDQSWDNLRFDHSNNCKTHKIHLNPRVYSGIRKMNQSPPGVKGPVCCFSNWYI
jgi:hypothetical protein